MIELRDDTIDRLPPGVLRPGYDRRAVRPGIAHLSVGNFHRAHQAFYVDRVLAGGEADWGIVGIGLIDDERERAKADALRSQDGLYTLAEFPPEGEPTRRVIGAIVEYLHAPDDPEAAAERLADPAIRIVSMTVTEGGYNTDPQGRFRLERPEVVADLAGRPPRTAFGLVTEALRRRRDRGAGPFTVLSCDNLRHNGAVVANAVLSFARARDPELAAWIEANVTFPASMVDRITPATLPADRDRLDAASGIADAVPVFAEDFIQWVLEDRFCAGRPPLERVGAQFTDDVGAYEQVKLRMLNGSHQVLSLPGLLLGHRLVHEAMRDPLVSGLVARFLEEDAAPLISAPPGMETGPYAKLLERRYGNPAIRDQLLRIAGDAAAKLPVYIQDTTRGTLSRGGDHRRLAFVLASYAEYLRGVDDRGERFDVFEPNLTAADRALAEQADLTAALRMSPFAGWKLEDFPAFVADFGRFRHGLREAGARATLGALLGPPLAEAAPTP